jgi:putative ABC transport system permease protein
MNFLQSLAEALDSLLGNKMRSALTILGIVIGVGAVIAMLALGRGVQSTIKDEINAIGTNLLFVFRGGGEEVRNPKPLTMGDAKALMDPFAAPSVAGVAPTIQGSAEISYAGESTYVAAVGVTPHFKSVRNVEMAEGEFITAAHMLARSAVVVLGPDVAENLFGHTDGIVGETVRVDNQPFRVIGVSKVKGGSSFESYDNRVWMPIVTAQTRVIRRPHDQVDIILVQAISADAVSRASMEIGTILRTRHRSPIGEDDFTIFTQDDFLSTASMITNVLTIFLGGIAAISLLVGGIGIMNIMLVSVTERTREIGLRKAIGARNSDILIQFLTESALLSLVGGLIGILLGWGLSSVVGLIAIAQGVELNPSISLDSILLATLFSTAVGLFFGAYPAKRAADLEPVEALRHD